jgi:uncharacterized repeat protein (TIGR03803 family)
MKIFPFPRQVLALFGAALFLATNCAQAHSVRVYPFDVNNSFVNPKGKLIEGPDGAFYGTAFEGGEDQLESGGDGYIYRITAAGSGDLLYAFTNGSDGAQPSGALALAPNGLLYGTADNGANGGNGVVYTITTGGDFNVIHTLNSNETLEGKGPNGSLVLGPDGQTFYGMTNAGGLNNNGVVYSVSLTGGFTKLRSFTAMNPTLGGTNADGANPTGGLTLGDDGNLYGVAYSGGANGTGTVFQITTGGSLKTIHTFSAVNTANDENEDGANPEGELAKDADGNFYGVAAGGGTTGYGVLYEITTTGSFKVIHYFTAVADGGDPLNVVVGPDGSLWGTAGFSSSGGGLVFGIYPNHTKIDILFPDASEQSGADFNSGLVYGSDGNFYGTTNELGTDKNGTFFEVVLNAKSIQPFSTVAGRYYGLLGDGSGYISIDIAPSGKTTARLIGTQHFTFVDSFDSSTNLFTETLPHNGVTLQMQLVAVSNVFEINGVGAGIAFTAYRSTEDAGITPSFAGKYSVVTSPDATLTGVVPTGDGAGMMTVAKTGTVTATGKMADGSAFRWSGLLLEAPSSDVFEFWNNKNFYGMLPFEPTSSYDVQYAVNWGDAAHANRYFPDGFTAKVTVNAAPYRLLAHGAPVINIVNGILSFIGGGLNGDIQVGVTINNNNTVTISNPNPDKVTMHLDSATGIFSGTFMGAYNGVTKPVRTAFTGSIYQPLGQGYGGFLGPIEEGTNASGTVTIVP